jgi:hypothetical protein
MKIVNVPVEPSVVGPIVFVVPEHVPLVRSDPSGFFNFKLQLL